MILAMKRVTSRTEQKTMRTEEEKVTRWRRKKAMEAVRRKRILVTKMEKQQTQMLN